MEMEKENDFARAILDFEHSEFDYNERENEELLTNIDVALIDKHFLSVAEMESTIARNWNKTSMRVVVRAAIRALGKVFSSRIREGQFIEQKNENYLRWCMESDNNGATIGVAAESLCEIVEAKVHSAAGSRENIPDWKFLYLMHGMLQDRTDGGLIFYRGRDEVVKIYGRMDSIIHACKDNDLDVPPNFEGMVKEIRRQLEESSDRTAPSYADTTDEEHADSQVVTDSSASSRIDKAGLYEERIRRGDLEPKEWRDAVYKHEIRPYIEELGVYDVKENDLEEWYQETDEPKIASANVQLMLDIARKGRVMTNGYKAYCRSKKGFRDPLLSKSFPNCFFDGSRDFYNRDKSLPTLALADDKCGDDSREDVLDRSRATILVRKIAHKSYRFSVDLDVFAQHLSKIPGVNALVHAAPLFQEGCEETVLVPDAVVVKEAATYHVFDPQASIAINYLCAPKPLFNRNWYLGTERVRFTETSSYIENKCISDAVFKMHNIDTPDSVSFISPNDPMTETARAMLKQCPNVYSLESLSRNDIVSIIANFMDPQEGGIGIPNPVLKASMGSTGNEVWMLKAGVTASTIADHIIDLGAQGKSSILQERVNSPKCLNKEMGGKAVDCATRSVVSRDITGQSVVTAIRARVGFAGSPVNIARGAREYFLDEWINMLEFKVNSDEIENQVREFTRKGYECLNATISQDPMYQTFGDNSFADYSSLMGADIMFRPAATVRTSKEKALYDEIVEQLPKPPSLWIFTDNESGNAALRMIPDHRRKNGWRILPVQQGTEQKRIQLSDWSEKTAKGLKWDSLASTAIEWGGPQCGNDESIRKLSSQLPDNDKNVIKWKRGRDIRRGQAEAIAYLAIQTMQNQNLPMTLSPSVPMVVTVPSSPGFEMKSGSPPQPFPPPSSLAPAPEQAQSAGPSFESVRISSLAGGSGTDSRTQPPDGKQGRPPTTENDSALQQTERNGSLASMLAEVLRSCCCIPWQGRSRGRGSNNRI
jgi:hypothetical protein